MPQGCALVPIEFKFHLCWIQALRWYCFGSPTSINIYCQKLNWWQVKRPTLTHYYTDSCQWWAGANKMYIELDLTFLGLKVPNVGMLITEEPNLVLDKEYQTKLPWIVGWNLIWLSYNIFIQEYGTTGSDSFKCPEGVKPLLLFQMCIFHHSDIQKNQTLGTTSGVMSWQIKQTKTPKTDDLSKKTNRMLIENNGDTAGVTIGLKQNLVCIPGNSVITMPGQTNKIPSKITCLVNQAEHHNLPLGIVINRCVATTKARSIPVILINTTKQNVWIQQPMLAAGLFTIDQIDQTEHRASMESKGDNINILFLSVPPDTIRVQSEQVEITPSNLTPLTSTAWWGSQILQLNQAFYADNIRQACVFTTPHH